jgi:endonuclease YncB( thermonuclease family)
MRLRRWIAYLVFSFSSPLVFSADLSCRVVAVSDGDTFTCLKADRNQIRVRMSNIDTPEKAQPYGQAAKQALSDLIFSKQVRIESPGTDKYRRTLGQVYVGDVYVNKEMVAQGAAWVYRQYNNDPSLLQVEQSAKDARRGLWGLSEAERIPPWEWRHGDRKPQSQQAKQQTLSVSSHSACGTKRYCRQMTDCADARFHLAQCGVSSLDGDRDGVPCEALCR